MRDSQPATGIFMIVITIVMALAAPVVWGQSRMTDKGR
jgi:hypothetical protein